MFGGWDGTTDLCDLWQFTVSSLQWVCLSADTSIEVHLGLFQPHQAVRYLCVYPRVVLAVGLAIRCVWM